MKAVFKIKTFQRILLLFIFFVSSVCNFSYAGQQGETAHIVTRITPTIAVIKQPQPKPEIFLNTYYDFSHVFQGARKGYWREETTMAGVAIKNTRNYFSVSQLKRFDQSNYTANFGTYINLKDAYCHLETGFGWDTTYIYKLQNIAEYGHKIFGGLYGQLGYNYRTYGTGNVHLVYPGLIYYFGNNYISADYGVSFIEGRGTGSFGSLKGNFAITDFLSVWAGGACGEWLYDINGFAANEEFGYLMFSGFTLDISKNVSARIGYSYGMEQPKFIKRGLILSLSLKF